MRSGLILLLVLSTAVPPEGEGGAAPFTEQSFEKAQAGARTSGKLFLVDGIASWCRPCKMMDRATWTDERVRSWIAEHAVAVKLDVDRDPEHARTLRIDAMPTLVIFKDGAEFDRVVGFQSADDLLKWLNGVLQGRRAVDALRAAAGDRGAPGGHFDVQAQYRLAKTLLSAGELDRATEEYLWLWDHMLEHSRSMSAVRRSFMAGDMKKLAERHPPARMAFRKLRDRQSALVNGEQADREDLLDWVHLNEVIGDDQDTLVWFDWVRRRPGAAPQLKAIARNLFTVLVEHGRWSDAGAIYPDPPAIARSRIDLSRKIPPDRKEFDAELREQVAQISRKHLRDDVSRLYAACLAAGRDDAARDVAALLLNHMDDAPGRAALVETALSADQPRPGQRRWLDEAQAMGEPLDALRGRLEEALAGKQVALRAAPQPAARFLATCSRCFLASPTR